MRRTHGRLPALTALAALLCPLVMGWAVALHRTGHGHHPAAAPGADGLEVALHGHSHVEGTPAHSHPVVGTAVPSLPARASALVAAPPAAASHVELPELRSSHARPGYGPVRDRPPRPPIASILRI